MIYGSLFSGIGGMDLGLDRAGMQCAWQVEIDNYARRILTKHWRDVPKFRDIRECGKHNLAPVDLIAGGFPCQDISSAGKRKGLAGERSGLWFEFYRVICELRPRYAIIENVARLTSNGLDRILCGLTQIGYDAEWEVISACAFGAPHTRERVFVLAYPESSAITDTILSKAPRQGFFESELRRSNFVEQSRSYWQENKPGLVDMDDDVSTWPHEIRGLGNAVFPPVAEWIGKQILAFDSKF